MPTTPDKITFAVQRCRELAGKIEKPSRIPTMTKDRQIRLSAIALLPHLAVVLVELERLREQEKEREKSDWSVPDDH